ncbi:hypothetical protein LZC95_33000 [Pendulispora brunnea]|uniref:Uncharacterized protein n=1 Tax=Pendulispora brunnea TaxID=2905690 RepID=A0ABZ2JXP1_9BACT
MPDAEIDAVALFRPKSIEKLRPFLDLDGEDEDEESEGLYAEALDDGSFLVFTFQPYEAFASNEDAALEWLEQFGIELPEVHADSRGLLFFPDSLEPEGRTYEAVVAEVEGQGIWVPVLAPAMPTSFEIGQMFEGMQRDLLDTIAAYMDDDGKKPTK